MRSFLYFVPNKNTLTPDEAAALGLAYALDGSIECRQVTGSGPAGQQGVVCVHAEKYDAGQLAYYPKTQEWRQIPGSEVWVGHAKGELPGPEDLARTKQLDGQRVELADGRAWIVPVARSYSESNIAGDAELYWGVNLPQKLQLAADGRWVTSGVVEKYAALWELAEAWNRCRFQQMTADDIQRFNVQGQIDATVLVLQANYRLGRVEASLLGLFTDDLVLAVLDALIDLHTWNQYAKKKMETMPTPPTSGGGAGSCAGPAGETPITGPPAPT